MNDFILFSKLLSPHRKRIKCLLLVEYCVFYCEKCNSKLKHVRSNVWPDLMHTTPILSISIHTILRIQIKMRRDKRNLHCKLSRIAADCQSIPLFIYYQRKMHISRMRHCNDMQNKELIAERKKGSSRKRLEFCTIVFVFALCMDHRICNIYHIYLYEMCSFAHHSILYNTTYSIQIFA